jgi:hypothetical protein
VVDMVEPYQEYLSMNYRNPAAIILAAEERAQMAHTEMNNMREELEGLRKDYDAALLKQSIDAINRYDEDVQLIISSHPILQEAWDNFRVQYQITASKALLETAREKIQGKLGGICYGCRRPFDGYSSSQREDNHNDFRLVLTLTKQVEDLTAELNELKERTK